MARTALSSLILASLLALSGCSSSIQPTYNKEDIAQAVRDICKKEYNLEARTKLVGQTLWIYLPFEDVLQPAKEPKKSIVKFKITGNKHAFAGKVLESEYSIENIPEREESNALELSKEVSKANNAVLRVLFRLLSSVREYKENKVRFIYLVTADIKNGFLIKETLYSLDIKKVFYNLISSGEFQHRIIQDTQISPEIIGDKEGILIDYKDVSWEEFLAGQIRHRIQLKFEKPEVDRKADIDREIVKIIAYTFKIYDFKDFDSAELFNTQSKKKIVMSRRAILEESY
ncbi:MAG: hypothetical protein PHG40_04625 [Candidatus Omnitrophica bacterium]|nr:hypothetical protein [Candidatus Omnitrophota bacterium]